MIWKEYQSVRREYTVLFFGVKGIVFIWTDVLRRRKSHLWAISLHTSVNVQISHFQTLLAKQADH